MMYLSDLQRERGYLVKEGNVREIALIDAELARRGQETKTVSCGCCGNAVKVSVDTNAEDFYCTRCVGSPRAKTFKGSIGWAGRRFFEARFPILRKNLDAPNQAKWDSFDYEKKCRVIGRMIERGAMI